MAEFVAVVHRATGHTARVPARLLGHWAARGWHPEVSPSEPPVSDIPNHSDEEE